MRLLDHGWMRGVAGPAAGTRQRRLLKGHNESPLCLSQLLYLSAKLNLGLFGLRLDAEALRAHLIDLHVVAELRLMGAVGLIDALARSLNSHLVCCLLGLLALVQDLRDSALNVDREALKPIDVPTVLPLKVFTDLLYQKHELLAKLLGH